MERELMIVVVNWGRANAATKDAPYVSRMTK
jgi:hypothetical protein